jgi:hypothetical protein
MGRHFLGNLFGLVTERPPALLHCWRYNLLANNRAATDVFLGAEDAELPGLLRATPTRRPGEWDHHSLDIAGALSRYQQPLQILGIARRLTAWFIGHDETP